MYVPTYTHSPFHFDYHFIRPVLRIKILPRFTYCTRYLYVHIPNAIRCGEKVHNTCSMWKKMGKREQ